MLFIHQTKRMAHRLGMIVLGIVGGIIAFAGIGWVSSMILCFGGSYIASLILDPTNISTIVLYNLIAFTSALITLVTSIPIGFYIASL